MGQLTSSGDAIGGGGGRGGGEGIYSAKNKGKKTLNTD